MSTVRPDLERHKRHILLKEIGGPGVRKLTGASVSIVGAGALGGPCALYLAAAGVGQVELWDDDRVDLSNLQRQIQFGEDDLGRLKVDVLADRLKAMNRSLDIRIMTERVGDGPLPGGQILIDATDNYESRFRLNEVAHVSGRLLVSGAASQWSGQLSVFASGVRPGAPCYQCFVPVMPPPAATCEEVGVVGALTGQVGTGMALEAVKLITGAGDPLIGRLQIYDGLGGTVRTVGLRADPTCPVCAG